MNSIDKLYNDLIKGEIETSKISRLKQEDISELLYKIKNYIVVTQQEVEYILENNSPQINEKEKLIALAKFFNSSRGLVGGIVGGLKEKQKEITDILISDHEALLNFDKDIGDSNKGTQIKIESNTVDCEYAWDGKILFDNISVFSIGEVLENDTINYHINKGDSIHFSLDENQMVTIRVLNFVELDKNIENEKIEQTGFIFNHNNQKAYRDEFDQSILLEGYPKESLQQIEWYTEKDFKKIILQSEGDDEYYERNYNLSNYKHVIVYWNDQRFEPGEEGNLIFGCNTTSEIYSIYDNILRHNKQYPGTKLFYN